MNRGAHARTPLFAALFVTSAIVMAPAVSQAAERAFDIKAQPMGEALNQFARQAGVQIFFPGEAAAGRRSPAVRGTMEPRAALTQLIAGSSLSIVGDDGKMIMLQAGPARDDARLTSDAATALEEIIVTSGPRAGDLKRNSDTVVNTITQLEIQRLPNLDVSDVLARLPGVRRNETQSGENRYVQIRGLNNAAASQSIDGVLLTDYVNGSRATSTELLSANFIKNVTVTSTVTPDLDENANSAHVALTTISGLDNDGQHVADFRAYVGANNRNDGVIDTRRPVRLAGSWKGGLDKGGKWGLAVGASLDRLGSRQDAVSVASFSVINGTQIPNGALTKGETYSASQRVSAMARLDYKPSEALSLFGEYFYLEHDFRTEQRTATVTVAAAGASNPTANAGQFNAGSATYGFNAGHPKLMDHIVQLGGDYAISERDSLSVRLGVTYNRVLSGSIATSGFVLASGALTTPVGYTTDHDALTLTPGSSALTGNPANYRLASKVTVGDTLSRDQNYFARIDYAHNMDLAAKGLGFKAGAQLKTLDRSNVQRGYARVLPTSGVLLSEVTGAASLTQFQPVDWNVDTFLNLVNTRGAPSPDANRLYAADPADSYGQNFNGAEVVGVGYGIVSYGWDRARLSAGVRAAHTHRELDQYEPDTVGKYIQGPYEQNYWHVLPSAYGSYDVTSNLKLRGAFTKTLERPAINSASRRLITSYDTPVTRSISYSNPYLMPIRSTNFDASAEYYYGRSAYLSFGAFAKDLRDISASSSSQSTGPDGVREVITYTSNVREVNGKKVYGKVRGLEAVWSDPQLPWVPERFGNVGLTLSYDYLVYQVTAINGGGGTPPSDTRLVDAAPRHFFNATLAYNKGPFAANLYLQEQSSVPSLSYNPANDRRTKYDSLLDLQASWQVSRNLRVMVEGRNLLDQDITDRYGVTNYGPAYQIKNNGRTVWLGFQLTTF